MFASTRWFVGAPRSSRQTRGRLGTVACHGRAWSLRPRGWPLPGAAVDGAKLVGRASEIAVVESLLAGIADGGGSLLVLGDPGIGRGSGVRSGGGRLSARCRWWDTGTGLCGGAERGAVFVRRAAPYACSKVLPVVACHLSGLIAGLAHPGRLCRAGLVAMGKSAAPVRFRTGRHAVGSALCAWRLRTSGGRCRAGPGRCLSPYRWVSSEPAENA